MCNFFVKVKILICYSIFGEISILIWATNTNFGYTWLRNSSQFGTPLGPRPGVLEYSIVMEREGGPAPRPRVLEYSIVMEREGGPARIGWPANESGRRGGRAASPGQPTNETIGISHACHWLIGVYSRGHPLTPLSVGEGLRRRKKQEDWWPGPCRSKKTGVLDLVNLARRKKKTTAW